MQNMPAFVIVHACTHTCTHIGNATGTIIVNFYCLWEEPARLLIE